MAQLPDGGPAFPALQPPGTVGFINRGMSMKAYLIAHAPDCPGWFMPESAGGDYEKAFMSWPSYWADRQIEILRGEVDRS